MMREPSNNHMFFAYHIRSAFLTCETALRDMLNGRDVSLEHFYVLRCDWKPERVAFDDIRAHSMLTKDTTLQAVNDLLAKGYIKGREDDTYELSSQGVTIRHQLLKVYREQLSKATEGVPETVIETALSGLLTVQNNLQES